MTQLPVVNSETNQLSTVADDGSRNFLHPADVKGRFASLRKWLFLVMLVIFAALPIIKIGGNPAVFLNISEREFYLFGLTFNAQDVPLMVFVGLALAFGILFVTALAGRAWCGYACPQTVFLEGVFRRIERWIDGPAAARRRLDQSPWTKKKLFKRIVKHTLFVAFAVIIANILISYFVSATALIDMVTRPPWAAWDVFIWMSVFAAIFYFNFAWFREQFCVVLCPYGRMQSVLLDEDSLIIGYDKERGEPRGKLSDPNTGDCIACKRCVQVCPTGIDIRDGVQMECIACSACVDACDEIMDKVGKPKGLIRYDSLRGFEGKKTRIFRPRILAYAAIFLGALIGLSFGLGSRSNYEVGMTRAKGANYQVVQGKVENRYVLYVRNKTSEAQTFLITVRDLPPSDYVVPTPELTLPPMKGRRVPIFVSVAPDSFDQLVIDIKPQSKELEAKTVSEPILGP